MARGISLLLSKKQGYRYPTEIKILANLFFQKAFVVFLNVFRMIAKEGKLKLIEINTAQTKHKICKIKNKTVLKGNKIQLNLHDGRNIIADKKEYKSGDTLMITLPEQKIENHFKLDKGSLVLITGGKYVGTIGTISELTTVRGIESNKAVVESEGKSYKTLKDYVFVIGKDKPAIALE